MCLRTIGLGSESEVCTLLKKAIVLGDQHLPYIDKKANDLVFEFIKDFKPDYIDLLGDLIDFPQISKFRKQLTNERNIQEDIDEAIQYLHDLRELCPNAHITLHFGNHLVRFNHYIIDNAEEFFGLKVLNLKEMLCLGTMNIEAIEEEEGFVKRGNLILTHGTKVCSDSAMTAKSNLQKYGMSVICGHTHRLGSHFKTDMRGMIGAWENGCLCNLNLIKQWGRELGNWQTGFSVITFTSDRFYIQQVPIIKNKILFGEKSYGF